MSSNQKTFFFTFKYANNVWQNASINGWYTSKTAVVSLIGMSMSAWELEYSEIRVMICNYFFHPIIFKHVKAWNAESMYVSHNFHWNQMAHAHQTRSKYACITLLALFHATCVNKNIIMLSLIFWYNQMWKTWHLHIPFADWLARQHVMHFFCSSWNF